MFVLPSSIEKLRVARVDVGILPNHYKSRVCVKVLSFTLFLLFVCGCPRVFAKVVALCLEIASAASYRGTTFLSSGAVVVQFVPQNLRCAVGELFFFDNRGVGPTYMHLD